MNEEAKAWEKRCKASEGRVADLESQLAMAKHSVAIMEAQKAQWTLERANIDAIVHSRVAVLNIEKSNLENEIMSLRERLKALNPEG